MAEAQTAPQDDELEDLYALNPNAVQEPPTDFTGRVKFLGPGLVLVGSVVGSGEIILTTTLGSMVGFSMLWFVLLSCWSKNIVQAELTRFTVSSGEPLLHAFNRLPGKLPGFGGKKVSWYIYFWLLWIIPEILTGGGIYGGAGQAVSQAFPTLGSEWWTVILAGVACVIVLSGTYQFLEKFMTVMVVTFTFITVVCAILLQMTDYAITWNEVMGGLTFSFPSMAIVAALAMYGGTGVGTSEQMAYTYWCVEKGYARFSGPADDSDDWVRRAKGWISVMQTDVKLTLLLLTCAFFVLFSTSVSGLGANARIFGDGMTVLGLTKRNDYRTRLKILRYWAVLAPAATASVYFYFQNPVWLLTVGQLLKAIKFPLIAFGTLYLRYYHLDKRIAPGWKADTLLWVCTATMVGLAGYIVYVKFLS